MTIPPPASPLHLPRHSLRLAAFQPDMPQNVGAMIRLCACLGLGFDIIEPCGFVPDDARLRRVALDYRALASPVRHRDWAAFAEETAPRRVILLTTRAECSYTQLCYRPDDILLVGQESAGVPEMVRQAVTLSVTIPLAAGARSLNVVTAAAIVASEALRQISLS